ncbi:MAG: nadC [Ignavibacteria bacterium]|nr:nadC [Ignavibacteria bacterium]
MIEYPRITELQEDYLKSKIAEFLLEDAPAGDVTSNSIIDSNETSTAYIQTQQDIIFAGKPVLEQFFPKDKFQLEMFVNDGEFAENGKILAKITGSSLLLLTYERPMLNLLQRLCGIATLTSKYVKIAKPFNVKILDTRKTTPGLRLLEKYAVACGGGSNHRLDLSSGILIKDNHIKAAGSITEAIKAAKLANTGLPIEVEAENIDQIKEALECYIDGLLLDNMSSGETTLAVKIIRAYVFGEKVFIESSGGITLDTLKDYVTTGIDAISIGALTHSATAAELHLEFE